MEAQTEAEVAAQMEIKSIFTYTDSGPRPVNEDFVLAMPQRGIVTVADGFGGAVAGFQAAKLGCEAVREFLEREAGDLDATLPFVLRKSYSLVGNVLFNAVVHSNRKVFHLNEKKNVHEKGGCSLIAAYLDDSLLAIASAGACSAFLIRDGVASELVVPKTYRRLMEPRKVSNLKYPDAPFTALGMCADMEPEIAEYRMQPGDWVMLSTDGITREVIDDLGRWQHAGGKNAGDAERAIEALKRVPGHENRAFGLYVF